ncbi:rubrerythrin family protein [Collimonas sp.]|jgi:rubrerythrin|uniref:rubrerythrin family protein n=1 Tax=Collimonas sp. TaxID=1963772 RepID=UPI0037C0D597
MANQDNSNKSVTIANLEAAFAGESMAHIRYRYFAKLAREAGADDVAKIFEDTAEQEVMHAFGHLDLLYPKAQLTPAKSLEIAIESETYEYTEMYPKFRHLAIEEGNHAAVAEYDEQIAESKEHAENFKRALEKAAKRFAALTKVEERHANHYQHALNTLNAAKTA